MNNKLISTLKQHVTPFAEKQSSWDRLFLQLEDFSQKNGHTHLPEDDEKYEELRDWLIRQIIGKKFLPETQLKKLDSLCVDWDMVISRDYRWQQMFYKLAEFKKTFGHCLVPQHWAEDKQLANWVVVQRRLYSENKLREDRKRQLENINFIWNIKIVFDSQWEEFYEQLLAFYSENNHCRVPGKYDKLVSWIERQRLLKKAKQLLPERERKLNAINFIWDFTTIKNKTWNQRFKELCQFKKQHGHSFVPVNYKENKQLGHWVALQRGLEAKGKLDKTKKEKLDEIGFVWSSSTLTKLKAMYEEQWQANFKKLIAYREQHGSCQVSLKIDPVLQRWTSLQRNLFYQGKLSQERIEKLNQIEFPWSISDGYWIKMYRALSNFKNQFGHTRVPSQWAKNPQLAAWVYRTKLNKSDLSPQKVELLNKIGFDWNLSRKVVVSWEDMYRRLVAFKEKHGHTRVPVKYATDPKLGKWVSRMRYEKDKLNPDRVALMEAINFYWGVSSASQLSLFNR